MMLLKMLIFSLDFWRSCSFCLVCSMLMRFFPLELVGDMKLGYAFGFIFESYRSSFRSMCLT